MNCGNPLSQMGFVRGHMKKVKVGLRGPIWASPPGVVRDEGAAAAGPAGGDTPLPEKRSNWPPASAGATASGLGLDLNELASPERPLPSVLALNIALYLPHPQHAGERPLRRRQFLD